MTISVSLPMPRTNRRISDAEKDKIREYYEGTNPAEFDLNALSARLGRSKYLVCRAARHLGLSNQCRPLSAAHAEKNRAASANQWAKKPHPRGMLGKKHTPETLRVVSEASKRSWATQKTFGTGNCAPENVAKRRATMAKIAASRPASSNYSRARGGRRPDLGATWYRSSWEANYARYLNFLMRLGVVEAWEFEPQTFWFEGIKRGACSYLPDFRVKYKGDDRLEYVELKGWVQPKDRTKWRRMKKYHPEIKLTIVAAKEYYALQKKWASAIQHWESDRTRKAAP
jgi:hypothetical protein